MRLLVPRQDQKRYERNTMIYEDYRRMLREELSISANQINTRLAAKYDISISMVRKIITLYTAEYPLAEDISQSYLVMQ